MSETPISLESLLTPSRTAEFDYPGYKGFKLSLTYLGRNELSKIRKKALVTSYNKEDRKMEETFDEDIFLDAYVPAVVKGWTGLKYSYLEELLLVDVSKFEPDDTLPYDKANVVTLMRHCSGFDQWITDMVGKLENFTLDK